MKGYKGFNSDLMCKGFQYKLGETHIHAGDTVICREGFHFCENPVDCFRYYRPGQDAVFHVVEAREVNSVKEYDSKRVAAKITIGKKRSLSQMIRKAAELVNPNMCIVTNGGSQEASSIRDEHYAVTSGNWSPASTLGDKAGSLTAGDKSPAVAFGVSSQAVTAGRFAQAVALGDGGVYAVTEGGDSHAYTTGRSSVAKTGGARSHAISTGTRARSLACDEDAHAVALGELGKAGVGKDNCLAVAAGPEACARGVVGSWLVLVEYGESSIIDVQSVKVDGEKILPNVWYKLKDGEFIVQ
jgi:uncharacterized protein YqkB